MWFVLIFVLFTAIALSSDHIRARNNELFSHEKEQESGHFQSNPAQVNGSLKNSKIGKSNSQFTRAAYDIRANPLQKASGCSIGKWQLASFLFPLSSEQALSKSVGPRWDWDRELRKRAILTPTLGHFQSAITTMMTAYVEPIEGKELQCGVSSLVLSILPQNTNNNQCHGP